MKSIMVKAEGSKCAISAALKTIWYIEADPSYRVIWKWGHDDTYVAVRTLRGSGVMQLKDGREYRLKEGSLLLIRLRDIKGYSCKAHQWVFYWFEFQMGDAAVLPDGDVYRMIQITVQEAADMKRCFSLLHKRTQNNTMLASAVFSQLLAEWLFSCSLQAKPQERLEPALQHILYHVVEGVTVPELAALCHMSERSFRSQFVRYMGIPPQKYIEHTRMDMAKELLGHTALQLKEIAEYLGYDNQYYFSRCFKRNFHVTPSQYRKAILKEK